MAAIVFLNLLIALMNATVQKVDSQRELYWKFTRTGIWADYFDRAASLPPPFTMFNILWSLPYTLIQVGKKARARWSSDQGAGKDSPGGSSCSRTDPESARKRLSHARLMMKLIRRTLEDRDDKNAATDAREDKVVLNNAELEKMKREIAQQVLQSIRGGGSSNT